MATLPYFVLSPSTILSMVGCARRPKQTPPPAEDWRAATVDVVIPTHNEAPHIVLCLASLQRQTLKPRRIMLVDDGSSDTTVRAARAFCEESGLAVDIIQRRVSIGKTPTLKRQARELDCDVQFVLDGDTVLESDTYLARTVEELYKQPNIASASGTVLPQRQRDRRRWLETAAVKAFAETHPWHRFQLAVGWRRAAQGVTNLYREVLYVFLQRFLYLGQNQLLGTMTNPIGCAVAYRRVALRKIFDHFDPSMGDNLSNSEDIFLGFAMLDAGYRNVHLRDVYARTVEPQVHRLPKQVYLWSSAFLQNCYLFDPLLRSPFKQLRDRLTGRGRKAGGTSDTGARRPVRAPAMGQMLAATPGLAPIPPLGQAMFLKAAVPVPPTPPAGASEAPPERWLDGHQWTVAHGRPAGWMLLMAAVEKVFFPAVLLILVLLGAWYGLLWTVVIETAIGAVILAVTMKGHRLEYAAKAVAVAPVRYGLMFSELITLGRFASDVWIRKNRRWRK